MSARATRWPVAVAVLVAFSVLMATGVALAAPGTTPTTGPAAPAGPALTRYEQTDPAISYAGTWASVKKSAASGRSYAHTSSAGASINIAFEGTRLDLIATVGSGSGLADVYVDGVFLRHITLGAAKTAYKQTMCSTGVLVSGVHTVRIVRNADNPTDADISIDAVDVVGALVKCQWVEQDNSLVAYEGSWAARAGAASSGGGDIYTSSTGGSVTVSFTGTYLAWVGQKDPMGGSATVTVDGAQPVTVGLNSSSTLYQQKLWDSGQLAAGAHLARIEWTAAGAMAGSGTGSGTSGTFVSADGFLVAGAVTQAFTWHRIQDSDLRVLYWGTWTAHPDSQAAGGSDKRAGAAQAMVTVTFTGKQLDWLATVGPGLGDADVSIDTGPAQLVHLSAPAAAYQQKVWTTGPLAAGAHTIQIVWDKNSTAGAAINVDAFDILGLLPATTDPAALKIMWAQQKLADLSYRPGTVDGKADYQTRGAVMAFQKWEGLPRNGKLSDEVFARLQTATRPTPKKQGTGTWIEVIKAKQVLLYVKDGTVLWTIPVATGSAAVGIETPVGTFKITRKTLETNPRWHPMYLRAHGYLAIHGYPNVPPRRASHGCVRTQIWDQKELFPLIPTGTVVYIY